MPYLDVPGAKLYYEVQGEGPLLLFIPGAHGTGEIFRETANLLTSHFTVVCWDRRGFSKSTLTGPFDINKKLESDADDAQLLISHLSNGPAYVYGSSSGGVVALALLTRHPEAVRRAMIHEPPAFDVLPEDQNRMAIGLVNKVYDTYRTAGPFASMDVFMYALFTGEDLDYAPLFLDPGQGGEIRGNLLYWYEFELRQYTSAPIDLDALAKVKEKVIPAAGKVSLESPVAGPPALLSQKLSVPFVAIQGGHMPYFTNPEAFARDLQEQFSDNNPPNI
uniref:ARAD1A11902p n=1 Tax=Blastobotrys adeninivorans TaxID=409370 RepID=A0A060T2Y1_BLAAD